MPSHFGKLGSAFRTTNPYVCGCLILSVEFPNDFRDRVNGLIFIYTQTGYDKYIVFDGMYVLANSELETYVLTCN